MMLPSWIFGGLLLCFILGVFIWAPNSLPPFKLQLLAFICALLAGLFTFFFTGVIGLTVGIGNWKVQATGGIGVFVLVLRWWFSDRAPVKALKNAPETAEVRDPEWTEIDRTGTSH
jgi:hypothetical protein